MATKIEWTQETWNPVRGCSRISPGCVNCYAERMAARDLPGLKSPTTGEPFAAMTPSGPRWTGKVELIPHMLDVPLKRRKPTTWFVNSMSDLFHEGLPFEDIDRVFAVMSQAKEHTFQVLTKRADRMRKWATRTGIEDLIDEGAVANFMCHANIKAWPLPNVWLGVSIEDQQRADERIPLLLHTPAAVRFLSVEPLLGPVDLRRLRLNREVDQYVDKLRNPEPRECRCGLCVAHPKEIELKAIPLNYPQQVNALSGEIISSMRMGYDGPKVDWVIAGGESGPGARPCDVAWIRSIVQQCKAAGVPCFVKQLGAFLVGSEGSDWIGRRCSPAMTGNGLETRMRIWLTDPKGGDMAEWPEDLRAREMWR